MMNIEAIRMATKATASFFRVFFLVNWASLKEEYAGANAEENVIRRRISSAFLHWRLVKENADSYVLRGEWA